MGKFPFFLLYGHSHSSVELNSSKYETFHILMVELNKLHQPGSPQINIIYIEEHQGLVHGGVANRDIS